jgi:putative aminopeptidase FrvX
MAKRAKVRTELGQWQDLASATTDLTAYSTTAQMNTAIGANAGLNLLNTTAFTTSAGVVIDNVFSSTYDNYKVFVTFTAASGTNASIFWYGRTGSPAADVTTNYLHQQVYGSGSSVQAYTDTSGRLGDVSNAYPESNIIVFDILKPNLAQRTGISLLTNAISSTGSQTIRHIGGWQNSTSQFTGIKIYPDTGNITGTISIYGYKK